MEYTSPTLGFEATYRFHPDCYFLQNIVDNGDDGLYRSIIDTSEFTMKTTDAKISLFKIDDWDVDFANIEVRTVKIAPNKREELLKQFTKLNKLFSSYKLVPSSISYKNNYDGGGHIHFDFSEHLQKYYSEHGSGGKFIANMLLNLNNMTNSYPTLLWAMNCPYDYLNAISSLNNDSFKKGINQLKRINSNIGYAFNDKAYMTMLTNKSYGIILRPFLQTFEFRFFAMPKDADGLNFNIDIAERLYKKAFDYTMSKKTHKPKYTDKRQLCKMSLKDALSNLKACADFLEVDYSEMVKHDREQSLRKRFELEKIHNPYRNIVETYLK